MKLLFSIFLLFVVVPAFSQETVDTESAQKIKIDSLYREDQFYFSFALNLLQNKPAGLIQDKFSAGFSTGFLRDFPLNRNRTIAIASGIGIAFNNFNQNLKINSIDQIPTYKVIGEDDPFEKNGFSQFLVEMPIEFRWRTSTYDSHKFWRVYAGFKLGYLLFDRSVFRNSTDKIILKNNDDFDKFQYGTYLSFGYNSLNLYTYYGLNSLFTNAKTSSENIDLKSLTIGVMFYIL